MKHPIPAASMKKAIAYFYLLYYCPPGQLTDFKHSTAALHKELAAQTGLKENDYFNQALPEVCHRIVAFNQATREPDQKQVEKLIEVAKGADQDSAKLAAFKTQMALIAMLPGRAKPENRLHRNKGCHFCAAACTYGYFTLVSEPHFDLLRDLLEKEAGKPPAKQSPLVPIYAFAVDHLIKTTGGGKGFSDVAHSANLAYCLLMLSMAKSRLAAPEDQLRILQQVNQENIRRQMA